MAKLTLEDIHKQGEDKPNMWRKMSLPVVRILVRTPITPNQVSISGGIFITLASVLIAIGDYPLLIMASLLIFLWGLADYVDGGLARAKNMSSIYGGWIAGITIHIPFDIFLIFGIMWHLMGRFNQTTVILFTIIIIASIYTVGISRFSFKTSLPSNHPAKKPQPEFKKGRRFTSSMLVNPFIRIWVLIISCLLNLIPLAFIYYILTMPTSAIYRLYSYSTALKSLKQNKKERP